MNETEIVSLYVKEQKSTYEIASMHNTYANKIRRILIKHGVELKTKSEAQKNAITNGTAKIPTEGKQRSEEDKLKISKSLKKSWDNLPQKEYDKRVKASKTRWESMSLADKTKMQEAAVKAIQVAGKEGSKLEKFLYTELTKEGFVVEFHKTNLIANTNLEIDMYVPAAKAIIEIDGPSHFEPIWGEEKLQKQIKADEHKTGLILSKGLAIIRIKNLSDSVCLIDKQNLKTRIVALLRQFENQFPEKDKRFVEIEI
jgi:very-short-patch-repair endonuclease